MNDAPWTAAGRRPNRSAPRHWPGATSASGGACWWACGPGRCRGIKGTDRHGRPYHALDPDTFFWAHATFVMVPVLVCLSTSAVR
ncbi:oxygenase MpaB family protein [Streptomyces sp. S1D4-11]